MAILWMVSVRMIVSQRREIAGTGARPLHEVSIALQAAAEQRVVVDEVFGGWRKAQKTHFADGGSFDQIYAR